MILKIGAAVIDGMLPVESANTPLEEITTSEGVVVLERPAREKGFTQSVSVSIAQKASYDLLRGYLASKAVVSVSFINESLEDSRVICSARIVGVDLAPIDGTAQELLKLHNMQVGDPESIFSGSLQLVVV